MKKASTKREFKLPNGKRTTSSAKYITAWRRIAKPICKATKTDILGFDPSISIVWGNKSIDFPVSFLVELNKTLAKCK